MKRPDSRAKAAEVWLKFDAELKRQQSPELPIEEFNFRDSVWEVFDPVSVAEVLLDKRRAFFGLKETALQGYTAWIIRPDKLRLRRNAIALAAIS
ncbi:hypothetical protein [Mesorhizobium sp. M7A.F.Ce.TU.012.03.2.1]|uniref:hypothetical protein n=1 Tax=Mesorhizobium sp. M7A.F.Ce.TU.012.03.2.1 TaxID=2493681 RepID=UPI000FDC05C5|nr:hypothetical protein [Mesorhizobium sp. M7A.F.Ce.TU.012.03.2.1]AZV18155.1 hypothetical protein EJ079_03125 [Mesorhizobium sp. M7A.F.Ce.TU.012.03.2.1]